MATHEKLTQHAGAYYHDLPIIRRIGFADLKDVLSKGLADFDAMPTHLAYLVLIYPLVIIVAAWAAAGYEVLQLVFPLLAGYTLIGPIVAVGTYELSRRREKGLDTSRRRAMHFVFSHSIIAIVELGVLLTAIYFAWLFSAQAIYVNFMGDAVPASVMEFIDRILNTPAGWAMIVAGNAAGFVFAAVVFSLSVVSFPLLLDRDTSVTVAVTTSIRAVIANPLVMAVWAFIVAGSLLIGSLPFFVGLAFVLPVLGHSSWHLYRKIVQF